MIITPATKPGVLICPMEIGQIRNEIGQIRKKIGQMRNDLGQIRRQLLRLILLLIH